MYTHDLTEPLELDHRTAGEIAAMLAANLVQQEQHNLDVAARFQTDLATTAQLHAHEKQLCAALKPAVPEGQSRIVVLRDGRATLSLRLKHRAGRLVAKLRAALTPSELAFPEDLVIRPHDNEEVIDRELEWDEAAQAFAVRSGNGPTFNARLGHGNPGALSDDL